MYITHRSDIHTIVNDFPSSPTCSTYPVSGIHVKRELTSSLASPRGFFWSPIPPNFHQNSLTVLCLRLR